VGCPQNNLPPAQCLNIIINIVCGASGGSGGSTQSATPLKHDPGDSPSVASQLCQLGNTTPNSGGDITDTYSGADYLWIGDEITFPNPPIVPNGYAIQVLIGPQSTTPTPVPQVVVWCEWTETGGPPSLIAPPYAPVVGPPPPFVVVPLPVVTSIDPAYGCLVGGTTVTIAGRNFAGATAVEFGVINAENFTVESTTSIIAVTQTEPRGVVDVTVTTPNGTSATGVVDQFTFQASPTVLSVSPNSGPPAGGTMVTITGTDFLGVSAVAFGSSAASGWTLVSASQIVAISPAVAASTVDGTVTTACGTSATTSADQYTYTGSACPGAPMVGKSSSGSFSGATSVSVPFTSGSSAAGSSLVVCWLLTNDSTTITPPSVNWVFQVAVAWHGSSWYLGTWVYQGAPATANTGLWTLSGPSNGCWILAEVAGPGSPTLDDGMSMAIGTGSPLVFPAGSVSVPCDCALAFLALAPPQGTFLEWTGGYVQAQGVADGLDFASLLLASLSPVSPPTATPTATMTTPGDWATATLTFLEM
jgi:hypothetical protein